MHTRKISKRSNAPGKVSQFRPTRKNPGIGKLKQGELAQFGYKKVQDLSTVKRHQALRQAIDEFGSLSVWRKLNAVSIYLRFKAPEASRIFLKDRDWVRLTFGIKKEDK
jgi:nucleotidyltransferase/DNA polymerase involved in DNA repair